MQVFQNETSGLYWVELGGVLWNNCTTDANCPGRAFCAVNASWSQYPAMCFCDFLADSAGPTCEEVSPTGWFFYYVSVLAALIASFWLAVAVFDLFRMIRWKRFHRDALSTSLIFAILGLFFTALTTSTSVRLVSEVLPPDATGSETDHSAIGPVTVAFAYLFSTLAMLNVSVVWIEIAENADKMRKTKASNITRYKRALALYYIFFFGIIALALALGNALVAAAFAVPGVIFIIITYVVGAFKMRKLLSSCISSSEVPDGSINALQKMRESLKAIEYAAFGVSFFTFSFVIWMGIWVGLGGFAEMPGKKLSTVVATLAWIFVACGNATVMWYLHGAIRRKGKAIAINQKIIVAFEKRQNEMPQQRLNTNMYKGKDKESQEPSGSITSPKPQQPSIPVPQAEESGV